MKRAPRLNSHLKSQKPVFEAFEPRLMLAAVNPTVTLGTVTSSTVNLSWNAISGASACRVYIAPEPPSTPGAALPGEVLVATLSGSATNYQITNLAAAIDTYMRVEVDNGGGTGAANVYTKTVGGPQATLDSNHVREVHMVAPNVLELIYADNINSGVGNDGPTLQSGAWTVTRASGSTISVTNKYRFSRPVGNPMSGTPGNYSYSGDNVDTDHTIYLVLGANVGSRDVLTIAGPTGINIKYCFSDQYSETPVIQVNQVGYNPRATQRWAYVGQYMGDGGGLSLASFPASASVTKDSTDPLVPRTTQISSLSITQRSANDSEAGCAVNQIDLSTLSAAEGVRYRVRIAGVGVSWPTEVSEEAAFKAYYTVARGLYYNRWAGDLTSLQYTEFIRPVDHVTRPDGTSTVYTADLADYNTWVPSTQALTGARQVIGGYHDAGDWDQRPWHELVPQVLMRAYETATSGTFQDNQLTTPQSGNGVPDLLDEAMWGIQGWEGLMEADGGVRSGIQWSGDGCSIIGYSSDDPKAWWTFGRDPHVTARAAGLFAEMAYLIGPYNSARKTTLQNEAISAYNWAKNVSHTDYQGHAVQAAELLYPAGELYRLTGNATYKSDFESDYNTANPWQAGVTSNLAGGLNDNRAMPDWFQGYIHGANPDSTIVNACKTHFESQASTNVTQVANDHAYRNSRAAGGGADWGNGTAPSKFMDQVINRMSMANISGYSLTAQQQADYFNAYSLDADYILGCNPSGLVFITGLGSRHAGDALQMDSFIFQAQGYGQLPGVAEYGPVNAFSQASYYQGGISAFYPATTDGSNLPLWYRYGDARCFVNCSEFTVWETEAPITEALSILINTSWSSPPASYKPGGFDAKNSLPSFGTATNRAPIAEAGPAATVTMPTNTINLAGQVADDHFAGYTITQTWTKVSGPGSVTFGNANSLTSSATFSALGAYVLQLQVSDGQLTSTDTVTITETANSYNTTFSTDKSADFTAWAQIGQDGNTSSGANTTLDWSGGDLTMTGKYANKVPVVLTTTGAIKGGTAGDYSNVESYYKFVYNNATPAQVVTGMSVRQAGHGGANTYPLYRADLLSDGTNVTFALREHGDYNTIGTLASQGVTLAGGANVYEVYLSAVNSGSDVLLTAKLYEGATLKSTLTVTDHAKSGSQEWTGDWSGSGEDVHPDGWVGFYAGPYVNDASFRGIDVKEFNVDIPGGGTNHAPVATADSYSTNEDTPLTVAAPGVLSNDTDQDSDPLTAVLVTGVSHGTLTLNSNGSFTYTPSTNWNGTDSFTYKPNDSHVDGNTVTVTLTVNPVNDAPVAVADSYSTNQNTALTVAAPGVLSNDTDVDGDTLTAIKVTDPTHGTLTLGSNGSFTYTPSTNYTGSDSFTYKANDSHVDSNTVTVSLTVNAISNSYFTTFSTDKSADFTPWVSIGQDGDSSSGANTTIDWTGGDLTMTGQYAHKVPVILTTSGSQKNGKYGDYGNVEGYVKYVYNNGTPAQIDVGMSARQYGNGGTNTYPLYRVDILSDGTNTTFALREQSKYSLFGTLASQAVTLAGGANVYKMYISATASGSDVALVGKLWEGSTLLATLTGTDHAKGGSEEYTSDWTDGGEDTHPDGWVGFYGGQHTSSGSFQGIDVKEFSVDVPSANHAPVAVADSYSTNEDTALTVAAPGVLSNDTDQDSDPLTAVLVTGVSHGNLTLNSNGSFTYTPSANWNGTDSFTYKPNDGKVDGNTVTVTLTVNPVNDAPVAVADSYSTNEDTALTVAAPGVLSNDTDVDGDTLTAIKVTDPAHGTLSLGSNGSFTYTPSANWNGTDSFTYKPNDSHVDGNTVTVSITVNPVNDAPVATADSYSTNQNTQLVVSAPGVLTNDTDVDGDTLTAVKVTDPAHGTLTFNSNGSFTYAPSTNWYGTDSFTYKPNDSHVDGNTVTVTLTVNRVNHAPVATADSYSTTKNTALTVAAAGVLSNDTDVDGDTLTAVKVANPSHGSVTLNSNGSFTYTPSSNYTGSDSFTYKANDGALDSNTVTVNLSVYGYSTTFSTDKSADFQYAQIGVLGTDAGTHATANWAAGYLDIDTRYNWFYTRALKVSDDGDGVSDSNNGYYTGNVAAQIQYQYQNGDTSNVQTAISVRQSANNGANTYPLYYALVSNNTLTIYKRTGYTTQSTIATQSFSTVGGTYTYTLQLSATDSGGNVNLSATLLQGTTSIATASGTDTSSVISAGYVGFGVGAGPTSDANWRGANVTGFSVL